MLSFYIGLPAGALAIAAGAIAATWLERRRLAARMPNGDRAAARTKSYETHRP